MAIKILSIRLTNLDADSVGSMYVELNKLPHTLIGFSKNKKSMIITCKEESLNLVKKVVARYV